MISIYINGLELSDYITTISWSGNYKQAARSLEFSISNYHGPIRCGDIVTFFYDDTRLFDGYIESRNSSGNIKAVDGGFYINKNKVVYNFKNMTPEAITKKICLDFGIEVGEIVSTGISMTRKYIGKSIYESIIDAYSQASEKTGDKYFVYFSNGKLNVAKKGTLMYKKEISEDYNVLSADFSESIANMVNRVLVYKDNSYYGKSEIKDYIETYGLMQEILTVGKDEEDIKTKAEDKLKKPDQKASVEVIGDINLITGKYCFVEVPNSEIVGKYYIESDKHTFSNGVYKTSLSLNYENLMDEKDIGGV